MPTYRLYSLCPDTGHITSAQDMHAADDVAAIYEVQQRSYDVPVELWQGARKVTRVDAMPDAVAYARRPVGKVLHSR